MKHAELFLVVYDISNDKRRTKLHDLLLDFGSPVQYSVFECLLDNKEKEKMMKKINNLIRPKKDSLRIYLICSDCAKKASTTLGKDVLKPTNEAVIVG
jgi:CRISPR-associated protein Cas2